MKILACRKWLHVEACTSIIIFHTWPLYPLVTFLSLLQGHSGTKPGFSNSSFSWSCHLTLSASWPFVHFKGYSFTFRSNKQSPNKKLIFTFHITLHFYHGYTCDEYDSVLRDWGRIAIPLISTVTLSAQAPSSKERYRKERKPPTQALQQSQEGDYTRPEAVSPSEGWPIMHTGPWTLNMLERIYAQYYTCPGGSDRACCCPTYKNIYIHVKWVVIQQ